MFSPLTNYLDQVFMDTYPEIIIFTADGEKLVYRIFETRCTDAWDSVYTLAFNGAEAETGYSAALDNDRFLILSTCLDGTNRDMRLLVSAVLEAN